MDYSEYMEKLGQCVEAMINEAIEAENLDDCETLLSQIALHAEETYNYVGQLSPDSPDKLLDDIDEALLLIRDAVDDIKKEFEGPDGYRHEKFTDAMLDGLATEGAMRVLVVGAIKCKGLPQVGISGLYSIPYPL